MSGIQQNFAYGRSFIPPLPTVIGQAYGGGYYAGKIAVGGGGVATHYLIVAPKATGGATLQASAFASTSFSDINGPTNSANIAGVGSQAAIFCEGLSIGWYTDWYLPAKNELEVLYYFLKPTMTANYTSSGSNANAVSPEPVSTNYTTSSPAQTSASSFITGGSEEFGTASYWSSTESSASPGTGLVQLFGLGLQTNDYPTSTLSVRAVRRIPV
jgi:hypothetical protein